MPIEKWLERRGYVHFDRPIAIEQVDERVRDPNYVAKHSFMPLIGYTIEEPRYKRSEREVVLKPRPIRYASHLDSHVFGFYAALLEPQYE
jgi:RNA-directed DNA polymerase